MTAECFYIIFINKNKANFEMFATFLPLRHYNQCCGSRSNRIRTYKRIRIRTYRKIRIREKSFRIRASGSKMNLKKNFSEKLIKFDNFSTKKLNLKIKIPFYQKYFTKKLISRIKICNLTH
jgi:hypothetical protein